MKPHYNMFRNTFCSIAVGAIFFSSASISAKSVYISNSGFESGLKDWKVTESVTTSTISHKGEVSVRITGEKGMLSRRIEVEPNTNYQLTAFIRSAGTIGVDVAGKVSLSSNEKGSGWVNTKVNFNSGSNTSVTVLAIHNEGRSYFDEFKLKSVNLAQIRQEEELNKRKLSALASVTSIPPSDNFDLSDWKLSVPSDNDGNGKSDSILEKELSNGYINPDFFYTRPDGGMVFKVPVEGFKTSKNTKFTRVELREMLRQGNNKHSTKGVGKNNWVFSSAPRKDRRVAGGVDGKLTGTVAIDHVTTTGDVKQVGRVVFAQIHAEQDEPIRFYYRKLPGHKKGSIYFAHEPLDEKDIYFNMVGSRSSNAEEPVDGIELGEKFSYEINVKGNEMVVKLIRSGKDTITQIVDMSQSKYDRGGDYMYFKAGAYLQDSTGQPDDYATVVYYELENTH